MSDIINKIQNNPDVSAGLQLGATDVLSVNLLKLADEQNNQGLRLLGSAIGFCQYYYFSNGLAKNSSIIRNQVWDVSSDIFVLMSGLLIWKEKLTQRDMLGIAFGITAIYLISSE